MQDQIELKRLFGHFSGVHFPPSPVVQFLGRWYMYLIDNETYVCMSFSEDGNTWSEPRRIFADWGWVRGAPSVIEFQGRIWMCVTSDDGNVFIAESPDGNSWPPAPKAILGDFRLAATLTIINGVLNVIVLDDTGTPFIGEIDDF